VRVGDVPEGDVRVGAHEVEVPYDGELAGRRRWETTIVDVLEIVLA
jgi:hypothetical protein